MGQRFSWTVVDDPVAHARATRRSAFFKSFSLKKSRSVSIVYAHYHENPAEALTAMRTLESMPIEANIAMIEEKNPAWVDLVTQRPEQLRIPKIGPETKIRMR